MYEGVADVFLDLLYNQSKIASIRQRAQPAEGELGTLLLVPLKIAIKNVHKP
jgi:hypothetical protein